MKKIILLSLVIIPLISTSQELKLKYKQELSDKAMDIFVDAKLRQFYMTATGDRLLLNSESGYFVYDLQNQGKLIGEGDHVVKSNFVTRESTSGTVNLEEGVEYHVFEEENIVIFLDWNLTKNVVKALDLTTGKELFVLDNYRFTTSADKQVLKALASVTATQVTQEALLNSGINAGTVGMTVLSTGVTQSQYNSAGFSTYATPLEEASKLLVKTEAGLTCLSVSSGKELWTYKSDITIGFAGMPDSKSLVLVNFQSDTFKKNERLIVKLDLETGNELWRVEPLNKFKENRTYLVGNRLICDYFGAEVFDLNTGKQLLLSIHPKAGKSSNLMSSFMANNDGSRSSASISSPSLVHNNYLYTSTWKNGPRDFPNDGSGKASFQKYDLRTGEKLWEASKIAKGVDIAFADDSHLFVRKGKAFGKSSLFVLNAQTGKVQTETDNIDGFVYRQGASDILTDKYLYRSGKKSIYAFDKQNWKVVGEFDGRDAKIGKLQASGQAGDNLMLIGDKGVAFFSPQGKLINSANLNIATAMWNNLKCFAFSGNKTEVFDLNATNKIQDIPQTVTNGSLFLISDYADRLSIINSRNVKLDSSSLLFFQE
ncbi:MAG: PQQ-binding-like beta-propeller repeat protein [Bacteroidota bacterium]